MAVSDGEYVFLLVLNISISGISFMFAGFTCFCYLFLKRIRTFSQKLIAATCASHMLMYLGCFMGGRHASWSVFCYIQAILLDWFQLSSVFWTTCLALTIAFAVFLPKQQRRYQDLEKLYHVFCWGLPLISVVIGLSTSTFGPTGKWCWLSNENYEFLHFYGFLWLSYIVQLGLVIATIIKLRTTKDDEVMGDDFSVTADTVTTLTFGTVSLGSATRTSTVDIDVTSTADTSTVRSTRSKVYKLHDSSMLRLRWYLVVTFIVWFFASVNRIYNTARGNKMENRLFWLDILDILFSRSAGVLYCIVYITNKRVLKELKAIILHIIYNSPTISSKMSKQVVEKTKSELARGARYLTGTIPSGTRQLTDGHDENELSTLTSTDEDMDSLSDVSTIISRRSSYDGTAVIPPPTRPPRNNRSKRSAPRPMSFEIGLPTPSEVTINFSSPVAVASSTSTGLAERETAFNAYLVNSVTVPANNSNHHASRDPGSPSPDRPVAPSTRSKKEPSSKNRN